MMSVLRRCGGGGGVCGNGNGFAASKRQVLRRFSARSAQSSIARRNALASACCLCVAFDKYMTAQANIATEQNWQERRQRLDNSANDPSYACSADARVLTSTEFSYFTKNRRGHPVFVLVPRFA